MRLRAAQFKVQIGLAALAAVLVMAIPRVARAQDAREADARAIAADLGARQFEKVAARFNATMAAAISVERLGYSWDQVVMQAGEYKSVDAAKATDVQSQHVVMLTCAFENATIYMTVAFDDAGKVSGLRLTPQPTIP